MKYLITGGCGFLGTNLALAAIQAGEELCVFDNLSRRGGADNLRSLQKRGEFRYQHGDIRSYNDVERIVREFRPDVIFHLAGQVAMTTSIADPRLDFETNVMGSHNVLESVRKHAPETAVLYSSTNKVYGDLEWVEYDEQELRYTARGYANGFDEKTPLDFRSPYGCSKGAADQYMLDYARIFGLKTAVFRHSSIFGTHQFSTYDQGWIGWFVSQALEAKRGKREPFTISGDGKQVRDVLSAQDLVDCYFKAVSRIDDIRGKAFNIGGGMANSFSLLELFQTLEQLVDVELRYTKLPWRQSDQKVFVADTSRAFREFGWVAKIDKVSAVKRMIEWVESL